MPPSKWHQTVTTNDLKIALIWFVEVQYFFVYERRFHSSVKLPYTQLLCYIHKLCAFHCDFMQHTTEKQHITVTWKKIKK